MINAVDQHAIGNTPKIFIAQMLKFPDFFNLNRIRHASKDHIQV